MKKLFVISIVAIISMITLSSQEAKALIDAEADVLCIDVNGVTKAYKLIWWTDENGCKNTTWYDSEGNPVLTVEGYQDGCPPNKVVKDKNGNEVEIGIHINIALMNGHIEITTNVANALCDIYNVNTGQPIVVNTPLLTDKNAIVSTAISGDFISNNTYGIALKTQNGFVMSQRIFMYNSNYELFITGN